MLSLSLLFQQRNRFETSERDSLLQELGALLRPHGATARNPTEISTKLHSSYRQFSLDLDETRLGEFVSLFKQILYFAVS